MGCVTLEPKALWCSFQSEHGNAGTSLQKPKWSMTSDLAVSLRRSGMLLIELVKVYMKNCSEMEV